MWLNCCEALSLMMSLQSSQANFATQGHLQAGGSDVATHKWGLVAATYLYKRVRQLIWQPCSALAASVIGIGWVAEQPGGETWRKRSFRQCWLKRAGTWAAQPHGG